MLKVAAALVAGVVAMGGWAVVTVKDLPEYFVAGQRYTIEFQVRQHGRHLLSGLEPRLFVSTSDPKLDEINVPARALAAEGSYSATFTAPAAARVVLTIKSGFGNSDLRLYPEPVVAAGGAPPPEGLAGRGRVPFVPQGRHARHRNGDLPDPPRKPEDQV